MSSIIILQYDQPTISIHAQKLSHCIGLNNVKLSVFTPLYFELLQAVWLKDTSTDKKLMLFSVVICFSQMLMFIQILHIEIESLNNVLPIRGLSFVAG